jgi:hypothetical protein
METLKMKRARKKKPHEERIREDGRNYEPT